jgi:hypothetical protein
MWCACNICGFVPQVNMYDPTVKGTWSVCPRGMLRRILSQADEMGMYVTYLLTHSAHIQALISVSCVRPSRPLCPVCAGYSLRVGFELEFALIKPDGTPVDNRTYCSARYSHPTAVTPHILHWTTRTSSIISLLCPSKSPRSAQLTSGVCVWMWRLVGQCVRRDGRAAG